MRFEKISTNKLKIILSDGDIPPVETLEEMIHSTNAKETFLGLLDKAEKEVGFKTKNYKIKVDAKPLDSGEFEFLVTKLIKLSGPSREKVRFGKSADKERKLHQNAYYKFVSFDDVIGFSQYLKNNKVTYINRFSKECTLYDYNDAYYLIFKNIDPNYNYTAKVYSGISEFSKFISHDTTEISAIEEHGNQVVKNNAISTLQKYFKN